jgi:hypothetical protein
MSTSPQINVPSDQQLQLIVDSYARLTGRALVAGSGDVRDALWNSAAVIVAHGTEPDPIFFYGNAMALALFEMDFESFTRMPSRLSAEPLLREARADLLRRVSRDGFIEDYSGVRIASSGKRFWIERAVVWNLIDANGECHGQAATFGQWTPLD